MAERRKREPALDDELTAAEIDEVVAKVKADIAAAPVVRVILRCHRERDQVVDIETTEAELAAGVAVPTYTMSVQVLPSPPEN